MGIAYRKKDARLDKRTIKEIKKDIRALENLTDFLLSSDNPDVTNAINSALTSVMSEIKLCYGVDEGQKYASDSVCIFSSVLEDEIELNSTYCIFDGKFSDVEYIQYSHETDDNSFYDIPDWYTWQLIIKDKFFCSTYSRTTEQVYISICHTLEKVEKIEEDIILSRDKQVIYDNLSDGLNEIKNQAPQIYPIAITYLKNLLVNRDIKSEGGSYSYYIGKHSLVNFASLSTSDVGESDEILFIEFTLRTAKGNVVIEWCKSNKANTRVKISKVPSYVISPTAVIDKYAK